MSKKKNPENKTFWQRNKDSNGYLLRKRIGEVAVAILRFFMVFGLIFLILQPLFNKISCSFMTTEDLFDSTINLVPRHFTTENYTLSAELMIYQKSLFNTFWVSLLIAVIQVASATLVGYGFARYNFPLKKFWFFCVILVILIPPQTISTPLYLHFRFFDVFGIINLVSGTTVNLRNSIWPYVMLSATSMGLKDGLYIFMLRQFFRGVPKELEEAAYVDGCGHFKTFFKIMLPDAKPMITSCFLFSFVWQWTDTFYSKMFMNNLVVLSRQLAKLSDSAAKHFANAAGGTTASTVYLQCMSATGTLMTIFPLIILYVFAQRGFVESLSQTGIKM